MNIIYAVQNGNIRHISEVDSGLKCNCICPSCNSKLVARKGDKKIHHFAHYDAEECKYGYETSLHLGAKTILSNSISVEVPDLYLEFPNQSKKKELIFEHHVISINDVNVEKKIDDIIPDIIIHTNEGDIIIEVFVTHEVDDKKLSKIFDKKIPVLEVDLSSLTRSVDRDDLSHILQNGLQYKMWKYHYKREETYKKYLRYSDILKKIHRKNTIHIDYCPINKRITSFNKPYANYVYDCQYCEFYLGDTDDKRNIICTGKNLVLSLCDLDLTQGERNLKYMELYNNSMEKSIDKFICPQCGNDLAFKAHGNKMFFECNTSYFCQFKKEAIVDCNTGEVSIKNEK